jgi:hypothetical protein
MMGKRCGFDETPAGRRGQTKVTLTSVRDPINHELDAAHSILISLELRYDGGHVNMSTFRSFLPSR